MWFIVWLRDLDYCLCEFNRGPEAGQTFVSEQLSANIPCLPYSARWKILLGFNCRNRLLLTGTPIQNTMAEVSGCRNEFFGIGLIILSNDICFSCRHFVIPALLGWRCRSGFAPRAQLVAV